MRKGNTLSLKKEKLRIKSNIESKDFRDDLSKTSDEDDYFNTLLSPSSFFLHFLHVPVNFGSLFSTFFVINYFLT